MLSIMGVTCTISGNNGNNGDACIYPTIVRTDALSQGPVGGQHPKSLNYVTPLPLFIFYFLMSPFLRYDFTDIAWRTQLTIVLIHVYYTII